MSAWSRGAGGTSVTRRHFLAGGALATLGLGSRVAFGAPVVIPYNRTTRRATPSMFLPDPLPADELRQLALVAVNAAREAGVEFADVRVSTRRIIRVPPLPYPAEARMYVGYGVRARHQGTWGFQYGNVFTVDAIAAVARSAAMAARRYDGANRRLGATPPGEWISVPVATGEWQSPRVIDPFTVPIDDYYRVMGALVETTTDTYRNRSVSAAGRIVWNAETRVFASTEGALVTQDTMHGALGLGGGARLPNPSSGSESLDIEGIDDDICAGFEIALRQDWIDHLRTGLDEAARLCELPIRPLRDVGRYPIVFDGASFAKIIGETISPALDCERVIGLGADTDGNTFLVPPDEILGASAPQFSPLLTARVDRALPSTVAVAWDDEGVVPEPYTLVEQGRVVDYHTSRETLPVLAEWYAKHGRPVRPHGGVVAALPTSVPAVSGGHLTVAASTHAMSVENLAKDMQYGFIIRNSEIGTDPELAVATGTNVNALEVRRGQIVARTRLSLQFAIRPTLKANVVALGDASTMRTSWATAQKGIPWDEVRTAVSAPAALCKDIDVISWELTT